jgi:predicted metal-dependent hydrolase
MQTPPNLVIHPRDLAFGRNQNQERWWLRQDPVATAFNNALSASFPIGERFFIDAVRRFKSFADPELQTQIAAFTQQESMHTREHVVFNKQMVDAGYDLTAIDAYLAALFAWARKEFPLGQLAATCALEHFTAILAHALITDERHLAGVKPEIARLWRWHAIEEIEHKSVAFDTFMAATRKLNPLARWALRTHVMFVSTILFFSQLFFCTKQFFKQDGIDDFRTWLKLLHYMFVSPGVMRRVMKSYFLYYLPGFHPWRVDDRALIADVERELEASYAVA